MNKNNACIMAVVLFGCMLHPVFGHIPLATTGGSYFGSGAGRAFASSSIFNENDSLITSLDVYSSLANSWCYDNNNDGANSFENIRSGGPLGTGGKISNVYNLYLFQNSTADKPSLFRGDYQIQHGDFGYIPLWAPNGLSCRLRERFLPNLWGTFSLNYDVDASKANTKDITSYLQVGEISFKWRPFDSPGLSLILGRCPITGDYSEIFDQMPLDNYLINGIRSTGILNLGNLGTITADLAAGLEFMGRTVAVVDSLGNLTNGFGILDGTRSRNHFYARVKHTTRKAVTYGFSGGYQSMAADSSQYIYQGSTQLVTMTQKLPASQGWHAGGEITYGTSKTNHSLVLAYGHGAVQTAWGSPDYVNEPRSSLINYLGEGPGPDTRIPTFTQEHSSLLYGVYWGDFHFRRLTISTGLWGMWSIPGKHEMSYILDTGAYVSDPVTNVLTYKYGFDTIPLVAQDFRALKCALKVAYKVSRLCILGLRYDGLYYADPHAHSNILDVGALAGVYNVMSGMQGNFEPLFSRRAALWDEEAVNTSILSPFVALDVARTFRIQATFAYAFYDSPVYRQALNSNKHWNISLSAVLNYRYAKLEDRR